MECPKCHNIIDDKQTVCPNCHKVLLVECPNCHSLEDSAVCSKCGYKILIKCSKCGRINPAVNEKCSKCGFLTRTSLAYQECEADEFASVIIKFNNLRRIRRLLKTRELYEKFYNRLKNLVLAYSKNVEGLFITYGDTYVLNFNKELSLPTSSAKAVRFALKLVNALTQLNFNIFEELRTNLGLDITIIKKSAEDLQVFHDIEKNVQLLNLKNNEKKYLKGMQITLDQYIWDDVNREYKTDSLYSLEENGVTTMFYEIVLDSYILPPDNDKNEEPVVAIQHVLKKEIEDQDKQKDLYSFKVFDINAKCSFENSNAVSIKEKLINMDFNKGGKIISLRANPEFRADISDIISACKLKDYNVLTVTCTEEMNYHPWGFFEKLFKKYYNLPFLKPNGQEVSTQQNVAVFQNLYELCNDKPAKSASPEDARFTYMDMWSKFLSVLKNTVIIIEGFEHLDDTSIQTLTLYFDNYTKINPNFIFITEDGTSVHSKIKSLLRTTLYTEIMLTPSDFSNCLATIKSEASNFIGSFYFEKLQENFKGSYLYFKYAIKYFMETGVLIDFENKFIVKDSKSVVIPNDLDSLYKARIKYLGKNENLSYIIGYSSILSPEVDIAVFNTLGIKDLGNNIKALQEAGLVRVENDYVIINNYNTHTEVFKGLLKKEAVAALSKNILVKIGSKLGNADTALVMGKANANKQQYLMLCNTADFAIQTGDYDTYLKNCLGFLSLIESVGANVNPEDIEARKKEVYNSILVYLYNYAPSKIYFIENVLLLDAIEEGDDEKIVKLSNLMLQGALISSNYTDAVGLLHNILSRMPNPSLMVDGAVNTRFLLLSLVNIEILYNVGNFRQCIDVATEIISVLKADIIEKIKPPGFSTNLFVAHIMETMRLAAFAKLYLMEDDIESFLDLIKAAFDTDLPDKDCIIAVRDFLACKAYNTANVEEYTPFSKIVFLILQEIGMLKNDYKRFAQNIYQAKLLADDIHQMEVKFLCDLLIAYAYAKIGITRKAKAIYEDVKNSAEKSAMFNILMIAEYLLAKLELNEAPNSAMEIVVNALDMITRRGRQAVILYVMFEKLYVDILKATNSDISEIDAEMQQFDKYKESLKYITVYTEPDTE